MFVAVYTRALQTQCAENITSLTRESDRLESMIMQSPDRAAREKALMESKVCWDDTCDL